MDKLIAEYLSRSYGERERILCKFCDLDISIPISREVARNFSRGNYTEAEKALDAVYGQGAFQELFESILFPEE